MTAIKKRTNDELRGAAWKQAQAAFAAWNGWGRDLRVRTEKYERLYQAKYESSDHYYRGYNKNFLPELQSQVETEVALLKQLTIGTPQWYAFAGHTADDKDNATAVTGYTGYQLEEMAFESKWERFCRITSLHGWALAEACWRTTEEPVTRPYLSETADPNGGILAAYERNSDGSPKTTRTVEVVYDGPDFTPLVPESVMLSPSATSLEDTDYIFIRKRMPWSWLKHEESEGRLGEKAHGVALESLEGLRDFPADSSDDKQVEQARRRWAGLTVDVRMRMMSEDPSVDVAFLYTRLVLEPHEDQLADKVVITILAGQVIGVTKLPYWHGRWPFVLGWRIRREGTWVGYGLGEAGANPQAAVNDLLNQALDNGTLNLMNMRGIDRNAKVKKSQLRIRPNGVIETDGPPSSAIMNLPVNDFTGTARALILTILDAWRRAVGMPATLFAQPTEGIRSATELTGLRESAGIRPQNVARGLGENVLTPFLSMLYALDEQYVEQAKVIRVLGEDGVGYQSVDFRDLLGHYDLHVQLATEASHPQVLRSAIMAFLQTVAPFGPGVVNLQVGVRALASTFPLGVWAKELVPPTDQELFLGQLSADAENTVLGQGQPVPVRAYQNHQDHLKVHDAMLQEAQAEGLTIPDKTKAAIQTHIQMHRQYLSQAMSSAPPAGSTKMAGGSDQLPAVTGVQDMMAQQAGMPMASPMGPA